MDKIKNLVNKLLGYSFVRFICVGGISTCVHYAVYVLAVKWEITPNIAYLMAFGVSIVCNYFLSSYFTFQVRPSVQKALQFLGAHLINLCNELLLLNLLLYLGIDKLYAPLLVFAIAFPLNFIIVRFALKSNIVQMLIRRLRPIKK